MATEPDRNGFDQLTDDELFDAGMRRCKCGAAVYPNGDPEQKHCEQDNRQ